MFIDLNQLDDIRYKFLELGTAVSNGSTLNTEYFQVLLKSTGELTNLIQTIVPESDLKEMSKYTSNLESQVKSMDKIVDSLTVNFEGMDTLGASLDKMHTKLSGLSNITKSDKKDKDELEKLRSQITNKDKKDKNKKKGIKLPKTLASEVNTITSSFRRLLSTLKIPVAGAVAAGLVGFIAYGVKEQQRMKAERGEVADILVTSIDHGLRTSRRKAINWISSFQERLQQYYGIAKGEIQSTVKAFSDAGVEIESWLKGRDKSLGMAGTNYASFALGIDKLMNIAGGSTARSMVDYAERYGLSLKESKDTIMSMLSVGGIEGGLGLVKFSQIVNQVAPALEGMGFSIDSTVEFMAGMQEHFNQMKIPKQLAGNLLAKGAQKMANGIANMSEKWVRFLAERMGMGKGAEGVQQFKESWVRMLKSKGKPEELEKFVNKIVGSFLDVFKGNDLKTKYALSTELGMGTEGAYLAMEHYKKSQDPTVDPEKRLKAFKNVEKSIRGAYKTEAEKRTEWERSMNKWMKGISKIGMGLMQIVSRALAGLILYFRLLPEYFVNMLETNQAKKEKRARSLKQFTDDKLGTYEAGLQQIMNGYKDLKDGGKGLLGAAFGSNMKSLSSAFTDDIPDVFSGATEDRSSTRKNFLTPSAPASVKVVTIPVAGPGKAEVKGTENRGTDSMGKQIWDSVIGGTGNSNWKGERPLQIVSYGMGANGDIKLALVGDCPRCNLHFDQGFDEQSYDESWLGSKSDVDVLTQMLFSEGGIGKINKKGGTEELLGIGNTAINRLKKKKYGNNLAEVITSGHGYGAQGSGPNSRAYSTAREVNKTNQSEYNKVRQLAEKLLSGSVDDNTGGATHFIHNTFGKGYGSKGSGQEGKTALPAFADPNKKGSLHNTKNIGTARFYGQQGKDTSDRSKKDTNYVNQFKNYYNQSHIEDDTSMWKPGD
jgi:hypothetical protein